MFAGYLLDRMLKPDIEDQRPLAVGGDGLPGTHDEHVSHGEALDGDLHVDNGFEVPDATAPAVAASASMGISRIVTGRPVRVV